MSKKSTKLNPIKVEKILQEKRIQIFSILDFQRIFKLSQKYTYNFLKYYKKKHRFVIRLKKGLYCLASNIPIETLIANKLYEPSYISLEYALAYWQIIPEMVYTITSITTMPTRQFQVLNKIFTYTKIKKTAFEYSNLKINDQIILIASPEKALADFLYLISLKKRTLPDRINLKKINQKELIRLAKQFKRPSLIKIISQLYDQSRKNKKTSH